MIFITLGSQKFQFNRLLIEVDRLVVSGKIEEEVFAQIGYSDYRPQNYDFKEFLNRDEFLDMMNKCDKVITHGGTGAIVGAVKQQKKVIAVPRLKKFKEHVDDHQLQIITEFVNMNFIKSVKDIKDLENVILDIEFLSLKHYDSNTNVILNSIEEFINRG
ncbi:PssE/Cps14G family polysaccharide biosynthesis glycosyltransferase [Clostridium sp.]|uniref:PssE/Cps14G family polysaccharide biosynthesis glycosyltransferase n=1 Tax=Clostridium sp. TaxID=1506 RepID=UPI003EF000FC